MARRMQRHRRFPSTSEISFFAKHGLTGHGQWRVGGSKVKKGCVSGGVKVDTKRILNVIMILLLKGLVSVHKSGPHIEIEHI